MSHAEQLCAALQRAPPNQRHRCVQVQLPLKGANVSTQYDRTNKVGRFFFFLKKITQFLLTSSMCLCDARLCDVNGVGLRNIYIHSHFFLHSPFEFCFVHDINDTLCQGCLPELLDNLTTCFNLHIFQSCINLRQYRRTLFNSLIGKFRQTNQNSSESSKSESTEKSVS